MFLLGCCVSGLLWLFGIAHHNPASREVMITGPSMSPALWGPHFHAYCDQCNWRHRVHAKWIVGQQNNVDLARKRVCFRCGANALVLGSNLYPGDRATLSWLKFHDATEKTRRIHLGDLVAIENDLGKLQVKRVVGLPGQKITIDTQGVIRADDEVIRPSVEDAWDRSVEVYTTKGLLADTVGQRFWSSIDNGEQWKWIDARWQFNFRGVNRRSPLLIYSHQNVHWDNRPDIIRDDDPANLGLRRETYPIDELGLFVEIDAEIRGSLNVAFQFVLIGTSGTRHGAFCELSPGRWVIRVLYRDSSFLGQTFMEGSKSELHELKELGSQLQEQVFQQLESKAPLVLRVLGEGGVTIHSIELRRPVRYDVPRELAPMWLRGLVLGTDEYMVVGDNGPASEDSRSTGQGVPMDKIVGIVFDSP